MGGRHGGGPRLGEALIAAGQISPSCAEVASVSQATEIEGAHVLHVREDGLTGFLPLFCSLRNSPHPSLAEPRTQQLTDIELLDKNNSPGL